MRVKRSTCTILCAAVAALVVVPAAPGAGKAGVAALQVALRARHLYGETIDGIRGPATAAALTEFQRRARVPADGVFGPRTRRALGAYARHLEGSRLLARGAYGWDVAALQFRLAWAGFPSGRFTGRFGVHLDRALRAFQVYAGIPADGVAGPEVAAALRRPWPQPRIVLAAPVGAAIGEGFGPRGDRFHAGLDFLAARGTPIAAAAAARVSYRGWAPGFGRLVVLDHGDGLTTLYAHLAAFRVRIGQTVGQNQTIGVVGATGNATGPHLHFEVRVRGAAIDPLRVL